MFDMAQKRKISVSLDEDLIAALEGSDETVSAQINSAVRSEVERRSRTELLAGWLDEMEATDGPIDEDLVARFENLLA